MQKIELSYLLSPQRGKDALIRNPMMDTLPGYSDALAQSGKVLSLRAALPWWSYCKEKIDQKGL